MTNLQQDLNEYYLKLEKNIETISSYFTNIKRKSFLGENIMLLDFHKKDFNKVAAASFKLFERVKPEEDFPNGYTFKGIDFRMVHYPKTNRIAITF